MKRWEGRRQRTRYANGLLNLMNIRHVEEFTYNNNNNKKMSIMK